MHNLNDIKEKVIANIKNIYDPEISVNIYDLGLIYSIKLDEKNNEVICEIDMTLTSFACSIGDILVEQVEMAALVIEEIEDVSVNVVFDPPWSQENISYEGRLELGII